MEKVVRKQGYDIAKNINNNLRSEWKPNEAGKDAAWELYIELATRVVTQDLDYTYENEKSALESINKVFGLTRVIIKKYKRDCIEFSKIAVVILNQKVRPFTSKWHRISVVDGFDDANSREFRSELENMQKILRLYTQMLGDMACVEEKDDLINIGVL